MSDVLLWFLVVEALGIASFPLVATAMPCLHDRGLFLTKIVGVLLVTYINYVLGSLVGAGNNPFLLLLGMLLVLAGGLLLLGEERRTLLTWLTRHGHLVLIEEAIFIVLFVLWALVRANHPALLTTEKPMDLALMTASHKSTSFPPYDPWLAGQTINYYYGGYLAVGTLVTLTGSLPAVGYNVAVALVYALVALGAYAIVLSLTRSWRWALLGPALVLLAGNLDWISQVTSAGGIGGFDFFHSSRIIEKGNVIDEFPAFSFLLGDLHPHVVALPFTILATGLGLNFALDPARGWRGHAGKGLVAGLVLAALATGALYLMNTWDWPTYLAVVGLGLLVPALHPPRWRTVGESLGLAVAVLIAGYILFLPFHLDFKPQYSTFGFEAHGTPTGQTLTMFGLFLIPLLIVIGRLISRRATPIEEPPTPNHRARPAQPAVDDGLPQLPMPSIHLRAVGPLVLFGLAELVSWLLFRTAGHLSALGLLLPLVGVSLLVAWRAERAGRPEQAFTFAIGALGMGLIMLCDVFYLRDNFCGGLDANGACAGALYRMNTVFKFYYQAWTLLALAAAAAIPLLYRMAQGWVGRAVALSIACIVVVGGLTYTGLSVFSPSLALYTTANEHGPPTLDGKIFLTRYTGPPAVIADSAPADALAIDWLTTHVHGHPTIVEADNILHSNGTTGPQDYWPYPGTADCVTRPRPPGPDWICQEELMSRISTFTGFPTILGWGGAHEGLWHGDAAESVAYNNVQTFFTSTSLSTIKSIVARYHVAYIYVGQIESYVYYNANAGQTQAAVARFTRLGQVVYRGSGIAIIKVQGA